jgi:hypothetical protein
MGNPLYFLGSFEGDVVEELEGIDLHAQRRRGGFTIPDEMQEEAANLLLPHLFGRPHVVADKMAGAAQVSLLGVRAVGLHKGQGVWRSPSGPQGAMERSPDLKEVHTRVTAP